MTRLIPLACALLVALGRGRAEATSILIDQAQMTLDVLVNLRFSGVTGQEFTPTLSSLDIVEVLFDGPGGTFPPDVQGDFSIGIHVGSISGPLIGTSAPVTLLTAISREMVRFEFAPSLALVPGGVHVLEINRLSGSDSPFHVGGSGLVQFGVDRYALGRGILNGQPVATFDLVFSEGPRTPQVIPEPRTLILTSIGLLAVFTLRRARRRPVHAAIRGQRPT